MSSRAEAFRRRLAALGEGVVIALAVIRDNWIRSALTILGVGVGVMVIVAFGALITGVRSALSDAIEASGPDNFIVTRFDFTAVTLGDAESEFSRLLRERPRVQADELEVVASVPGVDEALFSVDFSTTVSVGSESFNDIPAQGQGAAWPAYTAGRFIAGRNFTPAEVRARSRVTVISSRLAEDLFGLQDPVGRTLRASTGFRGARVELRVIGVYEPEANIFSAGFPRWLLVPHTTATRRLRVTGDRSQILVVPMEGANPLAVQEGVTNALRISRKLGPRDDNDFAILESGQIVDAVDELFGVLFLAVLALSSAGLLVGGIGVVGIMLISVTERTREIGIRKAIGARRVEILWQFLVEAGLLTGMGGAAGLAMGGAIAGVVAAFTPVPASIPLWSVVLALLGATLTGVVFGLAPALRASRLEPVEALRAE
ncbi:MAG: ABC transporter permease [Longimicrobiales bacterium]|nr:ABC transporter permease [Longimicrobiales bacterium]